MKLYNLNVGKGFILINLILIFSSCHKEDLNKYQITTADFARSVISEHLNQISISEELRTYKTPVELVLIANNRINLSNSYISQARAFAEEPIPSSPLPNQNDMDNLAKLNQLDKEERRRALIKLLIDSDQDLIGLHVRGISPTGIRNGNVRAWAADKLSELRENLSESQKLK